MQKKIIALAVAGLVSGAAFAQVAPNNVTLYGIIDMGYLYQGSNVAPGGDNYSGIDAGGQDGSRFGFKGNEDLGNGLSVGFETEFDFGTDYTSGGLTVAKNSLNLSGKSWGTVKAGSFGSVTDDIQGMSESGGMGWGNGVVALKVNDSAYNAVEYISPNWSGFGLKVGYSTNYRNSQDSAAVQGAENANVPAWFGEVSYVNGGLKVGFAAQTEKSDTRNFDKTEYVLAGGYNFGKFQLGAGYGWADAQADGVAGVAGVPDVGLVQGTNAIAPIPMFDVKRQSWVITAGFDVTAIDHIAASYSGSSFKNHDAANTAWSHNYDTDAFGISYTHNLSKRTNIYASAYTADANHGFITVDSNSGNTAESGYENGVKFGVRHQF